MSTAVCCGHEYTVANLRFARAVEPENPGTWTIMENAPPARPGRTHAALHLGTGKRGQPFSALRQTRGAGCGPARRQGARPTDAVDVFAAIRDWKDGFS